ncbi:hypothetical protein [Halopseudomonas salina]|uniref:hypothetical protein n=1 Tax=Halopseudomonas salina TaxID=1323744 RepID=UPI00123A9F70|nr:hypothetical protein [Halopseudomonas salina]
MSMGITEKELIQLREAAEKMQRWHHHWAIMRWFALLVGILSIALSIYTFIQIEWLADQNSYASLGLEDSKLVSLLGSMIDMRADLLRTELKMYFGLVIFGVVGLNCIILTIISWRGPPMQRYWLPLIKHVVESEDESRNT